MTASPCPHCGKTAEEPQTSEYSAERVRKFMKYARVHLSHAGILKLALWTHWGGVTREWMSQVELNAAHRYDKLTPWEQANALYELADTVHRIALDAARQAAKRARKGEG